MARTQKITSAATSVNMLPKLFSRMPEASDLFRRGSINLDIGGGRFETATDFLHSKGVHNFVYDPYNRDSDHNARVFALLVCTREADTVTLSNVLNVIQLPSDRREVLMLAARALRPEGACFITVYEGDRSGKGKKTSKGFQLNRRTKQYVSEVKEVFRQVDVVKHGIIVARTAL
jgi:hypothetical protein